MPVLSLQPEYSSLLMDYPAYDDSNPEFYSSSPVTMTGSCYEPPPVDHHGLMDSQTHRQSAHSYGYAAYNIPVASTMDPSMNMYHHTLWQNSQQALIDDKRGSVIMGQPLPAAAPPAKRKGGRKPKDDPNLPPIEKEKRRLRRLRNKDAAAKCRERRLNHTSGLLQQIEQLEKSTATFEEQITELRQHKETCEKLLQSHQNDCTKSLSSPAATSVKSEPASIRSPQGVTSPTASPPASINTPSPQQSPVDSVHHSSPPLADPMFSPAQPDSVMVPPPSSSLSRRKQATPRGLNLDISCADSHRRSSSSSSGDLQSPKVII